MSYITDDSRPDWARITPPANDFNKVWMKLNAAKKGWKKIPRMRNLFKQQGGPVLRAKDADHKADCECYFCEISKKGLNIFKKRLEKHGFRCIGRGYYSTVYAKADSDRVLKVTKADDNWYDYVTWARESGWAGKFAPMVYAYKKVEFKGDTFYIASMERMSVPLANLREKDSLHIMQPLISYHMSGNALATSMISSYNADLAKFLTDFKEQFKDQHRFDLHGGNMMLRDDQSFCLTDPICGEKKTEYKRLRERELSRTFSRLLGNIFESNIRY